MYIEITSSNMLSFVSRLSIIVTWREVGYIVTIALYMYMYLWYHYIKSSSKWSIKSYLQSYTDPLFKLSSTDFKYSMLYTLTTKVDSDLVEFQ